MREAERGLAGAGFADDAERLALAHREADAVHRLDMADGLAQHAALDRKPDLEVVGLHHDRRVGQRRRRIGLRLGREQRARIGMLGRGEDALDSPCSTILPDCITQTRSASLRTMPRSWVMNSIDMPSRACMSFSSLQDLRLHGDVERRGRLVGDQQIRLVGERHRDHHALALAAGQLVRIARQPPVRIGNADLRQQFERCARAPPRRSCACAAPVSRRSASRSCAAD